jgi:phage terminase large subunit-like protein
VLAQYAPQSFWTPGGIEHANLFGRFIGSLQLPDAAGLMEYEDWERIALGDFFCGIPETVILLPKKNGKTHLMAVLALFHLLTLEDAECTIIAASKTQANKIVNAARGFIKRSPDLQERLIARPATYEIRVAGRGKNDLGFMRVESADDRTFDGWGGTLGIVEEMHRAHSIEAYGIIRDGLSARNGQMVAISTAGDDEESPLGKIRQNAQKFPASHRDGAYKYYRSANGKFAMHEWSLEPTDDVSDIAVVKTANPLKSLTIEKLQERHDSPAWVQWRWLRFACGIWARGEGACIQPWEWDAMPEADIPLGATVTLGLDIASVHDNFAVVPVWAESLTKRVIGTPIILQPQGDGTSIDDRAKVTALAVIAGKLNFNRGKFIRELGEGERNNPDAVKGWADAIERARQYKIERVVFDPWQGDSLQQQCEREYRLVFQKFIQRPEPLSRADMRFMEVMRRDELYHNGDKLLRAHALNAVEKIVSGSGGERFYFGRPDRGPRKPTDALRAASMALDSIIAEAAEPQKEPAKYGVAFW